MDRRAFEAIVRDALEDLTGMFRYALENVAIVVEEEPAETHVYTDKCRGKHLLLQRQWMSGQCAGTGVAQLLLTAGLTFKLGR